MFQTENKASFDYNVHYSCISVALSLVFSFLCNCLGHRTKVLIHPSPQLFFSPLSPFY